MSSTSSTLPTASTRTTYISQRVASLKPSGIRRFFDIAATMKDVISLGIGEPDFDTPPSVIEAGIQALRNGQTHYTSNAGILELRQALAAHLERLYGVSYDPQTEIIITVGGSEAFTWRRPPCSTPAMRSSSPPHVSSLIRLRSIWPVEYRLKSLAAWKTTSMSILRRLKPPSRPAPKPS